MAPARTHGIAIHQKLQCIINNYDRTRKSVVNAILLKRPRRCTAARQPRDNLFNVHLYRIFLTAKNVRFYFMAV